MKDIDPAQVKDLGEARELIASLKTYIDDTEKLLRDELRLTKLQLEEAMRGIYGRKSEKVVAEDPRQLRLLADSMTPLEAPASADAVVEDEEELTRPVRRRASPPQSTPKIHEVIVTRLEPEQKICPECGKEKCVLGEDCSDKLDIIPARLVTRRTIRPRLACSTCKDGVVQAPLPPQLVPQGDPAAGLVAHVILSKYVDHVPLYRQEQQFLRLGVVIPRQRLCDWVGQGATWLQALHREMIKELLEGDYVQVDETPVRVMDPEVKGKTAQGYLWFYGAPGGDVVLDFQPGRSLAGPTAMLVNFRGTLQTDDYEVYPALVTRRKGELKRIGCWAHARRKFFEALGDDKATALTFLDDIRTLYGVERQARSEGLDAAARQKLRQAKIPEALDRIKVRLDALKPKTLPQSPLGKAIRYALNDWPALNG